jgi:hypothetical protein
MKDIRVMYFISLAWITLFCNLIVQSQNIDSLEINNRSKYFLEIGLVDVISHGNITDMLFGLGINRTSNKQREWCFRLAYNRYRSNNFLRSYNRFTTNSQESRTHGFYFSSTIRINLLKDIHLLLGPEIVFYDYERYDKYNVNQAVHFNLVKEKHIGLGPMLSLEFFERKKLGFRLETSYAFGYFSYNYSNAVDYTVIFESQIDFFQNGFRPLGNSKKYFLFSIIYKF